jgi:hypothetical protein
MVQASNRGNLGYRHDLFSAQAGAEKGDFLVTEMQAKGDKETIHGRHGRNRRT